MNEEIIKKLKDNFKYIHPLIFYRSLEKAESEGDLFDILSDIPNKFPIIWSEKNNRWVHTKDIYQQGKFRFETDDPKFKR